MSTGPKPELPVTVTDPCHASDAPRNGLERRMLAVLRDSRDLAFVRLLARALAFLLPAVALLYAVPGWLAGLLALPYLAVLYLRFGGPLMLMVHAVTHRPTFTRRGAWLEGFVRQGVPVFFGIAPWSYLAHHIAMHHADENAEGDISSTLGHVRDSPLEFSRYCLRFLLLGHVHMSSYLASRGRQRMLRLMWAGEAGFWTVAVSLLAIAPVPTLTVLVAPWVLTRFFLMAGNWAQHAFIQADAPDDGVRSSTILLNASHNHRCFNDGYHALHHRRPGLHWGDMAREFRTDWRYYAERGVILFDGIPNNQVVWWRLMRKDYGYFADRMVDTGFLPVGREARIGMLQARVRRRFIARKGLFELRERAARA